MTDELFFITVLTEALNRPETRTSLKEALATINGLGKKQRYRKGFENFRYFMSQVLSRYETVERDYSRCVILERAAGLFDDTAIHKILPDPAPPDEWETINALMVSPKRNRYPVIDLFCGPRKISRLVFAKDKTKQSVSGIVPNGYVLKLDTGWVLWKKQLTAEDVIWKNAFTGQDLQLAAESGAADQRPTQRIVLFNGQLTVSLFAGIESGVLEIQWGGPDGN